MKILFAVCLCFVSFLFGLLVGIKCCKLRFGIPKGATGVDDNGFVYD